MDVEKQQQEQQQVTENENENEMAADHVVSINLDLTPSTTTTTFMDLSPTDRLQRQLARSFNNVKETCFSPVPLKIDGEIPEWLMGTFYFMTPG
jgi:hypothetical protein